MIVIIIIVLFILFIVAINNISIIKENISLTRYKDLYLNTMSSINSSLNSNAVLLCNNLNTDTLNLQSSVTNLLSSVTSTNQSINNGFSSFTTLKNTINNIDIVNMDTKISTVLNNQSNLDNLFYSYTIRAFDGTVNNQVDPTLSNLNIILIPSYTNLINAMNTTNNSYTDVSSAFNTLNTDVNSVITIQTNISVTLLPNLISYQTSLNNNLTSINNEINISTQVVTDAYNYVNSNDISAIQSVLGTVYTTAVTNLNTATNSKIIADNAVANDKTNNQQLLSNQQIANNNYDEAYEILRFMKNHAYVITDLPNVSEVTTLSKDLSEAQTIYNFLNYFITNNLSQTSTFKGLATNVNNLISSINTTNNNIINRFSSADINVKTNLMTMITNALNSCNSSKSQLNTLKSTVTLNLGNLSTIISSFQSQLNDLNSFVSTNNTKLLNYTAQINSVNTSIKSVANYKIEYFYYPNSYSTWDSNYTTTPIQIGTIQNTGKLKKIYIYANVYSWYTCVATATYFNIFVYDKSNNVVWSKPFYIYPTTNSYMSIDYYNNVSVSSIPVTAGFTIRILVIGSSSYLCKIISTNVQSSVEIDIS